MYSNRWHDQDSKIIDSPIMTQKIKSQTSRPTKTLVQLHWFKLVDLPVSLGVSWLRGHVHQFHTEHWKEQWSERRTAVTTPILCDIILKNVKDQLRIFKFTFLLVELLRGCSVHLFCWFVLPLYLWHPQSWRFNSNMSCAAHLVCLWSKKGSSLSG